MRTMVTIIAGLLSVIGSQSTGAELQPGSTQIAATLAQLGPGWTSNRVVVLVDPLCSPGEAADPNESSGWLSFAHDILRKEPRREAYAVLRYYGSFGTNSWCTHSEVLVWIMRWQSKQDIGSDWGRDKATKESADSLPRIGEEVRCYQRHGMHNNIAFRRGTYLIDVEGSTVCGWEHLKRLAEVLDANFLKAQKQLVPGEQIPVERK
jgi:hypothetical protein